MRKSLRSLMVASVRHNSESSYGRLNGAIDTCSKEYRERFVQNQSAQTKYEKLLASIYQGGGDKARKRHTELNRKLLVRDRVKMLLDDESEFLELGRFAGYDLDYGDIPAAGIVMGIGKISGQHCVVLANDATVKGGTIYPVAVKKQLRGQEIAERLSLPCVYLVDSGGAFLPLQADIFPDEWHGGRVFYNEAVMGSKGIPQVVIVNGSCTAGAAYIPTMADDTIIIKDIGSLFLAGPPLVKAALGEVVSTNQLGGADVHCRESGCTDYYAADEQESIEICRGVVEAVSHRPKEPAVTGSECLYHSSELQGLAGSVTKGPNFVYQVLARICDDSRFIEFRKLYGSGLIAGYCRIGGYSCGILAATGELNDVRSLQKATQFVQMCDQRDMPLIILQNSARNTKCRNAEQIKAEAQLMLVTGSSTGHKITINIGDCSGPDWFTLCGRSFDPTFVFAWPNAVLDFEGLCEQGNVEETKFGAFESAARLWIDEVILPKDTRTTLIRCLQAINGGFRHAAKSMAVLRM